jgi:hypothetical protein
MASGAYLVSCALWANLIFTLGSQPTAMTASLSLGISWLAVAAGVVLSGLTTINLWFAARRAEADIAVLARPRPSAPAHAAHPQGHARKPTDPGHAHNPTNAA